MKVCELHPQYDERGVIPSACVVFAPLESSTESMPGKGEGSFASAAEVSFTCIFLTFAVNSLTFALAVDAKDGAIMPSAGCRVCAFESKGIED